MKKEFIFLIMLTVIFLFACSPNGGNDSDKENLSGAATVPASAVSPTVTPKTAKKPTGTGSEKKPAGPTGKSASKDKASKKQESNGGAATEPGSGAAGTSAASDGEERAAASDNKENGTAVPAGTSDADNHTAAEPDPVDTPTSDPEERTETAEPTNAPQIVQDEEDSTESPENETAMMTDF